MNTQKYKINGADYEVAVNYCTDENAEVTVNGVTYQVEIVREQKTEVPENDFRPTREDSRSGDRQITSPLPGVIVSVNVRPGDQIKTGQVVAVLEAMKMENEIQSEFDGTVVAVNVIQGDSILEGAPIVTIK